MSVLAIINIRVDSAQWEVFKQLYPKKSSERIREFISSSIHHISDKYGEFEQIEEINKKIKENEIIENRAQIEQNALKSRLDLLKNKENEIKNINETESEWISTIGTKVLENRGIVESWKSFQQVFLRFDFSLVNYKREISRLLQKEAEQ